MTLRGGSVRLCPRTPARPSVGVEKRLGVAGVPELGEPGLSGSWGEAGPCQAPCREARGPDPRAASGHASAPPAVQLGPRPRPRDWRAREGPTPCSSSRVHGGPARARSPRCPLEPGCLGLREQLFQGSFPVRRGAGTPAPSPSAHFQNTGVKNTPGLPPQAREGRLGGTRQPRPPPH